MRFHNEQATGCGLRLPCLSWVANEQGGRGTIILIYSGIERVENHALIPD